MSLYNMIHGENPFAPLLLAILGLTRDQVPRYRDCFWDGEHVVVYTRTGGGNRPDYVDGNAMMANQPGYIRDADDDFDNTYASFLYNMPPGFEWFKDWAKAATPPKERWETFFQKMATNPSDPQVMRVNEQMKPLFDKIRDAMTEPEQEKK